MREIKFRAWVPSEKHGYTREMTYHIDSIEYTNGEYSAICFEDIFETNRHECKEKVVLMQYTGLKDKNSKEIYEGDIVHVFEHRVDDTGPVSYKRTAFVAGAYDCELAEFENIEVIGNIYENPELLK